jgi:hypothetical protein
MGGSQSTPAPVAEIPVSSLSVASPSLTTEDMDKALNAVAAQAYDNIHSQLTHLQNSQLEKSAEVASSIQKRMQSASHATGKVICKKEGDDLIQCLHNNKSLLACEKVIDDLAKCSSN